ncbi:MAG TPA: hypothetical protein VFO10_05295 [Oligoflexus sp.]|uniref:hypothetical protein n=1 Tax=Oligoflexus sp. TaxID=1971216 RepID=UPI002D806E10|nr:hypothetical protein [Oligoflexus sp.]HET9236640.1 hypothetical protein [Oligoflexus sp.]
MMQLLKPGLIVITLQPLALHARNLDDSPLDGLRLGFGFSPLLLQSLRSEDSPLNYAGFGLNSALAYQFSPFSLGIKSLAAMGLQGKKYAHSTLPYTVIRKVQFVSFSSFIEYTVIPEIMPRHHFFISAGPAASLTSFAYRERLLDNGEEVKSKIASKGRGFDVSFGLTHFTPDSQDAGYIAINYISVRPGKGSMVDISKTMAVEALARARSSGLDRVQVFSLNFGVFLL